MAANSKALIEFLDLKELDLISTRLYYLYYRIEQAHREEKTSLFGYSFNIIIAIVGGFGGVGTLITFLKELGDIYKVAWVIATIATIAILLVVKERIAPKGELADFEDTIKLGIHLDQIFKQATEAMLLIKLFESEPANTLVRDLLSDNYTILDDSIKRVEKLAKELAADQRKLEKALRDIHGDRNYIERRVTLGTTVLEQCKLLIQAHQTK